MPNTPAECMLDDAVLGVTVSPVSREQRRKRRLCLVAMGVLLLSSPLSVAQASTSQSEQVEAASILTTAEGLVFDTSSGTITGYTGGSEDLVIPSEIDGVPVVAIGSRAFSARRFSRVIIHDGLTEIGELAFSGCAELTEVTLPASIDSIGYAAFGWCPISKVYGASRSFVARYFDDPRFVSLLDSSPPVADMVPGASLVIVATGDAALNDTVWSSSDPTVAAVDESTGLVKALSEGSATIIVEACTDEGVVLRCSTELRVAAPLAVYRFYRASTGTHFYTANEGEMARVRDTMASVYRLEGVAYYLNTLNPANSAPLWRFFNMKTGTHMYTASPQERGNIHTTMYRIYRYEGVAYYVSLTSGVQVHRFYSPRTGVHFYSGDPAEVAYVRSNLARVWSYEGPAYCVAQ